MCVGTAHTMLNTTPISSSTELGTGKMGEEALAGMGIDLGTVLRHLQDILVSSPLHEPKRGFSISER